MLKSIEVSNFKGLREPTRIVLRPITMLFGPNSAGKSTMLDALEYTWQLLSPFSRQSNPLSGRNSEDFGRLVHGHDRSQDITLRLSAETDDKNTSSTDIKALARLALDELDGSFHNPDNLTNLVSNVSIELVVKHDSRHPVGRVHRASAKIDSSEAVRIQWPDSETFLGSTVFVHPQFLRDVFFNPDKPDSVSTRVWKFLDQWLPAGNTDTDGWLEIGHLGDNYVPDWGGRIFDNNHRSVPPLAKILITHPFQNIREQIDRILHIGPIRTQPPLNFHPDADDRRSWYDGLAAWAKLFRLDEDGPDANLLSHVNRWLGDNDHLATGHNVVVERSRLLPETDEYCSSLVNLSSDDVHRVLEKLDTHTDIRVRDLQRDIQMEASDVGSGIAQLIPIIVASMSRDFRDQLLCFEQPELHVHPRLQAELGDLFLSARTPRDDRHFLIETHSEHLLLRFLRRIRETTNGKFETKRETTRLGYTPEDREQIRRQSQPSLNKDELAVYWVQRRNGQTDYEKLHIDDHGDFAGGWPDGFFDERMDEL